MDRRTKFKQDLSPVYLPYYEALCDVLPLHWQPYQGYRTFEQQAGLYAQGRHVPGKIVTMARGGESAHNYGCASDWILWDIENKPVWIEKDDPAWQEYVDAIEKVGLQPGKAFGDIDHNELKIDCSWKNDVLGVWKKGGMDAAQTFLKHRQTA